MSQTSQPKQTNKKQVEGSDFELSSLGASNDECLSEAIKKEKKEKKKLKKSRIKKKMNKGSWSVEQESMFLEFMLNNRHVFQEKQQRRSQRIFKKMRNYIKTRSHEQCRSHHQKYQQKHHHFDLIVHYLKVKIQAMKPKLDSQQHSNPIPNCNPIPNQKQRYFKYPATFSRQQLGHQQMFHCEGNVEKNFKRGEEGYSSRSRLLNGEYKMKVDPTMVNAETILEKNAWKLIQESEKQMLLKIDLEDIDSIVIDQTTQRVYWEFEQGQCEQSEEKLTEQSSYYLLIFEQTIQRIQ